MSYSFNGVDKIISLLTSTLDVKDVYSRWKDWICVSDNSKFETAFRVVGGDPIDEANGIYVTSYFFLSNGWKIKPQEANHKLVVSNGVLVVDGVGDPFIQTIGNYNVLVQYSQPIKSETVATGGGTGPSVSDIAEGVWTASSSGYSEGTTGKALSNINITVNGVKINLDELWALRGLDATKTVIATPSLIKIGNDVEIEVSGDGISSSTLHRTK